MKNNVIVLLFIFIIILFIKMNNYNNDVDYIKDKNKRTEYFHMYIKVTAYNSEVSQTDSDPYTGAWNNKVEKGMVAISRDLENLGITNGIKIKINGKNYIIKDRMNKRKREQMDIWMENKQDAENWGIKVCKIEVPIERIKISNAMKMYSVFIML